MSWSNRNLVSKRFSLGLNSEDAFVLGYFGTMFEMSGTLKDEIDKAAQKATDQDSKRRHWSKDDMPRMLSGLIEGVSGVPGGTLNKAEITAMGGTKWGMPTNFDFGDQITLKFRELSGMPIRKCIAAWMNLCRHTNAGISMLVDNEYTKTNWTADLTYWIMRPNGKTVECGLVLQGVYPMSDLTSQISTDLTAVDGQTFDVNFHVDDMWWDYKTTAKAQAYVNEHYEKGRSVYYNYDGSGQTA